MVARGIVREAHGSLEALQVRLKEVRDRLDRVSREEAHYLELATMEHKLLQVRCKTNTVLKVVQLRVSDVVVWAYRRSGVSEQPMRMQRKASERSSACSPLLCAKATKKRGRGQSAPRIGRSSAPCWAPLSG